MKTARYLVNFNYDRLEKKYYDVVIIGSGVSGLYAALCLPDYLNIAILTKDEINISNSELAQGGIAVCLDKEDSTELHFKDTLFAGAGLCNPKTVNILVNNAAYNIENLCRYGVEFDRGAQGKLSLTREGAHSKNRIVHVKDATGKVVTDTLIHAVRQKSNVSIFEKVFVIDILTKENKCFGVLALDNDKKAAFLSNAVICASGGYGQLYYNTTNPEVATGDSIATAYRAGAELVDLEFVQFHPTVLFHPKNKSFLISEAVRGEGAILRNINGERFMPSYHELAELAPRDIVSRSIFNEMKKTKSDHVYLDITFKDGENLKNRFPTIFNKCLEYGIDMSKDYIPIAPAEHYCMGGIKTDEFGRTNIKGMYACGEAACSGIHGANRLASNSLLECLVFSNIIAQQIKEKQEIMELDESYEVERKEKQMDISKIKEDIKKIMTECVGIIRDENGLNMAKEKIKSMIEDIEGVQFKKISDFEVKNMLTISQLVIISALERKESRGSHFRQDYPETNNLKWQNNIIVSKEDAK